MKYVLIFGALAGGIVSAVLFTGIAIGSDHGFGSLWFGYLTMLVALSFVFVGVKRYRDVEQGGVISFGRALALGLGIATVASLIYMVVWEGYLAATGYQFMDQYIASARAGLEAQGITGTALDAQMADMEAMGEQYDNPIFRLPMTFVEIFPVGLLIAVLSAALLRNPRVLPARA